MMKSTITTPDHTNLSNNLNSIKLTNAHPEKNNNCEDLYTYNAIQPILTNPPITSMSEFSVSSSMSTLGETKSSQTEPNEDIPYKITSPLPPIFNSQLCHLSRRIPYLSNSLPNLSTLNWVMITEEETIQDEAEQALNDHYDQQIQHYYEEAREKLRLIYKLIDLPIIQIIF